MQKKIGVLIAIIIFGMGTLFSYEVKLKGYEFTKGTEASMINKPVSSDNLSVIKPGDVLVCDNLRDGLIADEVTNVELDEWGEEIFTLKTEKSGRQLQILPYQVKYKNIVQVNPNIMNGLAIIYLVSGIALIIALITRALNKKANLQLN